MAYPDPMNPGTTSTGGAGFDWMQFMTMLGLGMQGAGTLWGAANQSSTNNANSAAQQAQVDRVNNYVSSMMQPGTNPYSQQIMQFLGGNAPAGGSATGAPAGGTPGTGVGWVGGTGFSDNGLSLLWSPSRNGFVSTATGQFYTPAQATAASGLTMPQLLQHTQMDQAGLQQLQQAGLITAADFQAGMAGWVARTTNAGAPNSPLNPGTGGGAVPFTGGTGNVVSGDVAPAGLASLTPGPQSALVSSIAAMTPEQRNARYNEIIQGGANAPMAEGELELLNRVTGGGTGSIGTGANATPIPQSYIDLALNPFPYTQQGIAGDFGSVPQDYIAALSQWNPQMGAALGAGNVGLYQQLYGQYNQNATGANYAPNNHLTGVPGSTPGGGAFVPGAGVGVDNFPGGTGSGSGSGGMFRYSPVNPGAGVGTPGYNPGQDALLQMMRRDIGQAQYDPSLGPNLQSLGSGNSQFDNTELFRSLGVLDDQALNKQADALHASAGSIGQRFGTAMNRNEAEMRGNFAAQTQARNAGIAQQSFEAAQGRRMPALGQLAQMGQFGGQQALGLGQLQAGAAGQAAGNTQNMQQFNAQQGNIYNQLMLQGMGMANQAQQGQNSYNLGLLGVLNGVGVPQQQASPWPGAIASLGQTGMMYPILQQFMGGNR